MAKAKSEGAPRGRKRVPSDETKEAKFVRLAQYRVTKALNVLRNVKNLAKYPHNPEQGAKIVEALRDAIDGVEASFSESPRSEKPAFTL